jgi:hypothetical protein
VTDVDVVSGSRLKGGSELFDPLKHNVVIVCSKEDQEALKATRKGRRDAEMTLIAATPSLKRE